MRATAFCLCLFMLMGCQNNSGDVADNGEPTKDGGDPGDVIDVEEEILPPMPCIEDWPKFPEVAPVPSLTKTDGEWGDIIWRKRLRWSALRRPLAFDGKHLALTSGNKLWILDTSGNITGEFPEFSSMIGSAPVADGKGNFLFATQGLFSVTALGELRWAVPFGKNISPSYETTETSLILLSPDGMAYVSATDGFLYAVNVENGEIVWKKKVGLYLEYRPMPLHSGIGNMLFMNKMAIERNSRTGYSVREKDGKILGISSGIANSQMLKMSYIISSHEYYVYFTDRCGNHLWNFPEKGRTMPLFSGFNDTLWVTHGPVPAVSRIYSPAGIPISTEKQLGAHALVLGADNLAYFYQCKKSSSGENFIKLSVYDDRLEEVWSKEYDIYCSDAGLGRALGKDGTLYISTEDAQGIEIIAIRTGSPGLASTSSPINGHNNRQTRWLAPGQ